MAAMFLYILGELANFFTIAHRIKIFLCLYGFRAREIEWKHSQAPAMNSLTNMATCDVIGVKIV